MRPRIHPIWPTWLTVAALVFAFFGERVYAGGDTVRTALAVLAAAGLAVAVVVRLNALLAATADQRPVLRVLAFSTVGVAAALALYALIPLAFSGEGTSAERVRAVLWAIWPIVLAASLLPLLAVEAAVAPVAFNERYEQARVRSAALRALALGLFTAVLFLGNFLASRHDTKWELSAGHSAVAGEDTRRAIRDLSKPVKVVLFFPRGNEVAESMERYLEPLKKLSPKLTVERVDHALAGSVAKDVEVTENGWVALVHDGVSEKIRLGTSAKTARSSLRRFDQSFVKALVKVTTSKQIAYYTTGHHERAFETADKEDKRPPAKEVKRRLTDWQYTVRPLGVADGLASKLPDDAGIVFVMGPERPFLEAEVQTLLDALGRGARIFLTLEGERDPADLAALLGPLGLAFDPTILANERTNVRLTRTEADHTLIYSTKASSHEAVTTMTRNAGQLAVAFSGAGALALDDTKKLPDVKAELVITALDDTFRDSNRNLKHDPGEPKERFGLAAVVTRTSTTGKRDDEGRLFVLADADAMGDDLLQLSPGNVYLLRDAVLWLRRNPEPFMPTTSEEDVRIVYDKEKDALVFYGTTFGVPLLVLFLGYLGNRRRRRS